MFQALDFLPRDQFLRQVIRSARGATTGCQIAATHAEESTVEILPGDFLHAEYGFKAQPDALITSTQSYVLVEAKRIRRSSFGPEQVARELLLAEQAAAGRTPLLLIVLGAEPPVSLRGHGTMTLTDSAVLGAELISARLGRPVKIPNLESTIAYISWAHIADRVQSAVSAYLENDVSASRTTQRLATTLLEAVRVHL